MVGTDPLLYLEATSGFIVQVHDSFGFLRTLVGNHTYADNTIIVITSYFYCDCICDPWFWGI